MTCLSGSQYLACLNLCPAMTCASRLARCVPRTTSRLYHSYSHPPPPCPFPPLQSLILSAATPHIASSGFTPQTLARGARDAGYIDASVNLFPDGAFSLVLWHMYTQRRGLAARKDQSRAQTDQVEALLWDRLMGNHKVIGKWQEVRTRAIFYGYY